MEKGDILLVLWVGDLFMGVSAEADQHLDPSLVEMLILHPWPRDTTVLFVIPLQNYQFTPPHFPDLPKPEYMSAAHHTRIAMFRPPGGYWHAQHLCLGTIAKQLWCPPLLSDVCSLRGYCHLPLLFK